MAAQMSMKKKVVNDGVFFAELNEVLTRDLRLETIVKSVEQVNRP